MPKLKTKKLIAKRFKVTKNGKVIKRREGQDHFNAGKSGNNIRRKRRDVKLSRAHKTAMKAGLPGVASYRAPRPTANSADDKQN